MSEDHHSETSESTFCPAHGDICQVCHEQTKIIPGDGGFFKPRLRGINELSVGKSKIISSPITILLEYVFIKIMSFWTRLKKKWASLFSYDSAWLKDEPDSQIVGRLVYPYKDQEYIGIHHTHIEFMALTWNLTWKKIAMTDTDKNGYFKLPYLLKRIWTLKIMLLRVKIFQTRFDYLSDPNEPKPVYEIYHTIKIKTSNLTGMTYNLRDIPLSLWEYRRDTPIPRTLLEFFDSDAPEYNNQERVNAMSQQFIPVELTKLKHLHEIKYHPDSISMASIQNDYPMNLTGCMEKKRKGSSRDDSFFGQRIMNGMYAATFVPIKDHPGEYYTRLFGACDYDVTRDYAFPSIYIRFRMDEHGVPLPIEIETTGPLTAYEEDAYQKRTFSMADGEDKWLQAKRVARVTGGLGVELDDHFSATHVNTEQFALAAFRNLRKNPIARLLFPHLKEVSLINHAADLILVGGPSSYIQEASALTSKGVNDRIYDIMGALDWKGWSPMEVLNENHTYAKAQNLFWDLLGEYVEAFFAKNIEGIKEHWFEVHRFSQDLVKHSVAIFGHDLESSSLGEKAIQQEKNRQAWYHERYRFDPTLTRENIDGVPKAISPITKSDSFVESDLDDLKQACRYSIMMATFMHTWVNEHQYDDIGEVLYSCLGLRFSEHPDGVMNPESDLSIAPDLTRSTQMLWFSNLLSRTEYGFITKNEDGDIPLMLSRMLEEKRESFKALGVDIDTIEARTNI